MSEKTPFSQHIKSFVRHHGRLTEGQQHALTNYWPAFGIDFDKQLLDLSTLGDFKKTVFEIGFGNGESLITMAQESPDTLFIGAEVHRPGIGRALMLAKAAECKNVRIIAHDAVEIIDFMLPENSIDRVQLFFPDPWHKKRHFKRRIVQPHFCQKLHRILKSGGIFHIATDWVPYAEHCEAVIAQCPYLINITEDATQKPSYRPETKFERRGQKLGHEVRDLCFKNSK